jgi:CBS domain containing-hemolysin-like protein
MIWGVVLFAALALSAFFSGSEIAFFSTSAIEWSIFRRRHPRLWRFSASLHQAPRRLLLTLLTGNNLALVLFGWAFSTLLQKLLGLDETASLWVDTGLGTLILFLAGEYLPKIFAYRWHRTLLPGLLPLLTATYWLLFPIIEPLYQLLESSFRRLGISAAAAEKITGRATLLSTIAQASEPEFREILANALHLRETPVREIMVPRHEIAMIEISASPAQAVEMLRKTGFSRLLVYEKTPDQVRGYVYIRSLLQSPPDLRAILQDVIAVPESMPASKLLELLVQQKRSLAIVVDARGGLAGLVTTEDLVEEVFGEIQDEHDRAEPFLKEEAPGTYLVEGRWEIEAINKKLGLALPSENAVTLSGLIVETLGRIPRPGETWEAFGLAWTILQATRQRIQTVKIRVL